jgi:glucokinase
MAAEASCVLGLDVGGTYMKGAVIDAANQVRFRKSFATGADEAPEQVLDRIAAAFTELAAQAPGLGLTAPGAAGLCVPGIVDDVRGVAVTAANLPWRDAPLGPQLRERLGIPVALGHDVRTGGLAESVLGAAAGATNALFLPLGTGIAACCVVDGRPLVAGGFAGELGHVVVHPGGEQCPCGQRGCLERYASAAAIARRYTESGGNEGKGVDGSAAVAALVRDGDPIAVKVWDEAIDALVRALHTALTLLGSEVVVVGGGLAEAGDLLLAPLLERLDQALTFQRRPRLVRAALGDQAGCLGAGLLAWRTLSDSGSASDRASDDGASR